MDETPPASAASGFTTPFTIAKGLAPEHRAQATAYFWEAFQGKLGLMLNPPEKACRFIESVLDPSHAISAVSDEGKLLGVAGFKTPEGAFVGGEMGDLARVYGTFGGLWRGLFLQLLERPTSQSILLMDGIFVGPEARGLGVGTARLKAIAEEARQRGLSAVRLDVIDINPRARALYTRFGFKPVRTQHMGPLRLLFGFSSATEMQLEVG